MMQIVPYTLEMLSVSAACVVASCNLQPDDMGLNMMPLWHAGEQKETQAVKTWPKQPLGPNVYA
jgi:hypothetical protein